MEFHIFNSLPLELRYHIWRLSVDDTKYFQVHVSLDDDRYNYISDQLRYEDLLEYGKIQYRMEPWPALQACREARDALLVKVDRSTTSDEEPFPPWLSWQEMTFVCDDEDLKFFARDSRRAKVVNLIVTDTYIRDLDDEMYPPSMLDILSHQLPSLRRVVLLAFDPIFAVYSGKTYFSYSQFDLVFDMVWGKELPFEVIVGHEDVPEEEWLTRENYTELRYYDEDSVKREGSVEGLRVVHLVRPVRVKGEWRPKKETRKLFDGRLFL